MSEEVLSIKIGFTKLKNADVTMSCPAPEPILGKIKEKSKKIKVLSNVHNNNNSSIATLLSLKKEFYSVLY